LRCPAASLFLQREWIDYAFRTLWDRRLWSWMRKQGQFLINALENTGLASVAIGSTTVVGTGTAWTTDLVNRQFRIQPSSPIYTILSVDAGAQTLELMQPYGGPAAVLKGYQIYNAYVTVPSDFQNFISVIDVRMNWQLNLDQTLEMLNSWDAQRSATGTAYCIVPFDYDDFNSPPLPRYEVYPHQTAQYVYPFWYVSRPPDLSDRGATLPRTIRGDVLLEMALAQCARWPGPSREAPNPYFNLTLAQQHDAQAERMIMDMERTDDEIYEIDAWYGSSSGWSFAPLPWASASFLQDHAI
jgi:hypothetical protein